MIYALHATRGQHASLTDMSHSSEKLGLENIMNVDTY